MDDAATPQPYIDPDSDHDDRPVCGICPSLRFPREAFVIYDRPTWEAPFDPDDGRRYTADRTPACVHPHKIGLEPDRQAPPPQPLETEPATDQSATPRRSRWWRPSRGR